MLIDESTGFRLSQMSAIAFYLGETLGLLPESAEGRAMTIKIVNDANDVIDDITNDGGREMWTDKTWKAYIPRLERWMEIFEVSARHGGPHARQGLFVRPYRSRHRRYRHGHATLWWTLSDRFPPIGDRLHGQAPLIAGLVKRLSATRPFQDLIAFSDKRFGRTYCGGQIEASMRKVIDGE
ncbi:MAG: glutathione S-transferase [Asticcacaulis sp.]